MLISIVTINYNNCNGLKKTMASVLEQSYSNIEYIIIDGASTDGSKAHIESCQQDLTFWVSEADKGVYHAMNKGVRASKGDYLLFLNSGDFLFNPSVLKDVSSHLDSEQDIYYGDIILCRSKESMKLIKSPNKLSFQFFYEGTLPHQASFIKRTLFKDIFLYNEDLAIVSDWEFFICAINKFNCSYHYLDVTISIYNAIGISSNKENRMIKMRERQECLVKHFPSFVEDYEELRQLKSTLKTSRFKMLSAIEKSKYKLPKKLISIMLLFFFKIFGR